MGMQAETMPRLGSAVDQTETIPRDPFGGVERLALVRLELMDCEGLTSSVHGRVGDELDKAHETNHAGPEMGS